MRRAAVLVQKAAVAFDLSGASRHGNETPAMVGASTDNGVARGDEVQSEKQGMRDYFQSRWVKAGLVLLLVGAGPLAFIIIAAALGLWPDPNPNPVGPGLLFFVTFWPAVICIVIGVTRVRVRSRRRTA